ncbi:EpsG family protein [Chitinophaga sp. Ak27]|uniref:EpsG family protein n=1 Tax=Chitinophaga sp. Ak27 TaxID=2726116 RepID=UPI00145E682E|nr:EpsG family protein [Chitinophaga sp. Ak27]NLU94412.1 EpsG family protein [Chitinophaga sp. Ak27]
MLFYLTIFIVLFLFCVFDYVKDISALKKFLIFIFGLFFVLVAGLRWKTGTDWGTYYDYFSSVQTVFGTPMNTFEAGFSYLNLFVRNVTSNYTILLLISAILIIPGKFKFFGKYTALPLLAIFLYYAYFFCDIFFVRQSIAITFTLLSTKYIIERKLLLFALFVYIASLFHGSAILFIFSYFIFNLKISNKFLILLLLASVVCRIIDLDIRMLQLISGYLGFNEYLNNKMTEYLQGGEDQTFGMGVSKGMVLVLGILKRAIIFPFFFWFRNKISADETKVYNGYLNLLVMGTCLYFLTGNFVALQRISTYFFVYEILLIVLVVKNIQQKTVRSLAYMFIFLFAFTKFYYGFSGYKDLYIPYYSVFDTKNINRY